MPVLQFERAALHCVPGLIESLQDAVRQRSLLQIDQILFQVVRRTSPNDDGIW